MEPLPVPLLGRSIGERVRCERRWASARPTSNKRQADQLPSRWETEVLERCYCLPKSSPPVFANWADDFLAKVAHPNTRKRYGSSLGKLKSAFTRARLSDISAERIEEYKEERLPEGVEPATINHDRRVLRRMMRLAERKRLISRNPFLEVDFLKPKKSSSTTLYSIAVVLSYAMKKKVLLQVANA